MLFQPANLCCRLQSGRLLLWLHWQQGRRRVTDKKYWRLVHVVKLSTDLQILDCELHKNAFGSRATPGPAGGAIELGFTQWDPWDASPPTLETMGAKCIWSPPTSATGCHFFRSAMWADLLAKHKGRGKVKR